MSEEWGPWIEHDGKGCPCPGKWVMCIYSHGEIDEGPATREGRSWVWDNPDPNYWNNGAHQIIEYRIRRPRALLQLIEMVENLPAPAKPRVDA